MRVDKMILRAALSTLAAIFVLFVFMLGALCFIYPSTMMSITYDLGLDGASMKYAMRTYNRTEEIYYVAFATETAIGADDDEKIVECGERFIQDKEFTSYCQERNQELPQGVEGTYEQYVYGQVTLAKYRRQDKTSAVALAFESLGNNAFPKNNAVVALALNAVMNGDNETVRQIKVKMQIIAGDLSGADKSYFEEVYALLNE